MDDRDVLHGVVEQLRGAKSAAGDSLVFRKSAGETIFSAGDKGRFMYVVDKGSVDIVVVGTVLESVEAGGIVGEMALIGEPVRTADLIARTDCELLAVDRRRFLGLVEKNPEFSLGVMKMLWRRITEMNARLADD